MNIGLYFGTFNPIHVGHLIIANYMANFQGMDQVWLVVSPQNPLKEKAGLLSDFHRLSLVKAAIEENPKLRASDVEFKLPIPSYTVTTLAYLKEKHPKHTFSLINHEVILKNHEIYVYPRVFTIQEDLEIRANGALTENPFAGHPNVHICSDAPVMRISASFIRKAIKERKDIRYLLTEPVHQYIEEMHFYR